MACNRTVRGSRNVPAHCARLVTIRDVTSDGGIASGRGVPFPRWASPAKVHRRRDYELSMPKDTVRPARALSLSLRELTARIHLAMSHAMLYMAMLFLNRWPGVTLAVDPPPASPPTVQVVGVGITGDAAMQSEPAVLCAHAPFQAYALTHVARRENRPKGPLGWGGFLPSFIESVSPRMPRFLRVRPKRGDDPSTLPAIRFAGRVNCARPLWPWVLQEEGRREARETTRGRRPPRFWDLRVSTFVSSRHDCEWQIQRPEERGSTLIQFSPGRCVL